MVETYRADRSNLLYIDPPYDAPRARNYGTEMNEAEHRKLAELCLDADAGIVVSGYGGIWDDVLSGWYRYTFDAVTTQGGGRAERFEVLWSNRPLWLRGAVSRTETPAPCDQCAKVIRQPKTGRRHCWCSDACKQKARRAAEAISR
jgi:DNA adenine methylase